MGVIARLFFALLSFGYAIFDVLSLPLHDGRWRGVILNSLDPLAALGDLVENATRVGVSRPPSVHLRLLFVGARVPFNGRAVLSSRIVGGQPSVRHFGIERWASLAVRRLIPGRKSDDVIQHPLYLLAGAFLWVFDHGVILRFDDEVMRKNRKPFPRDAAASGPNVVGGWGGCECRRPGWRWR
jgi:hypothetical protein